jgi:hypothetical protein
LAERTDAGFLPDVGEGIFAAVAAAILAVVALFVVLPFLIALLDLLLVALLAVIGSAARGLLGRPWVVEAVDSDGHALAGQGARPRPCERNRRSSSPVPSPLIKPAGSRVGPGPGRKRPWRWW